MALNRLQYEGVSFKPNKRYKNKKTAQEHIQYERWTTLAGERCNPRAYSRPQRSLFENDSRRIQVRERQKSLKGKNVDGSFGLDGEKEGSIRR